MSHTKVLWEEEEDEGWRRGPRAERPAACAREGGGCAVAHRWRREEADAEQSNDLGARMMRGSERCCAAALLAVAARMRSTPPLPERRAAHAGGGGERRARRIRHKACKPPLAANARTTWASPPPWRCHHSLPVPVAPSRCSGPRSSSRESKRCSLRNSTVPGTQSQVQGLGSALVLALVQECWCRRLGSAAHRFWKHRSPTRQSLSPASTCAAPTTRGSS
ncbi:unnamed protein product [Prorocentrum cordatum]|uniref:Uncharacterized protein n=1 Tax=Prorocentrum cordatum TaxID=2364126 RepID=A0ABN9T2T6_9DINO|nr:unnamed protein product [Polarella glacialis]